MSEKKNQHYVPKMHLRNFSVNNNRKIIGLFNFASNKFVGDKAPIESQSSENWYYGKDLKLENALEKIEAKTQQF